MKTFLILFCLIILLSGGCNSPLNQGNDDARIVLGKSIDKVEIGDDSTTVIRKLGEPDEIAIGDYPGYFYMYTQGKYTGIHVTIHDDDEKGVQVVSARSPYSGVTDADIGIGTSRETVLQFLGNPDFVGQLNNDRVAETYRYKDNSFKFIYNDGKIEEIRMGTGEVSP
jgi:hypothetical protein